MERRRWDSKTKALIVLQGLKGKSVSELCREHQISQTQYYKWRDQFLASSHKVFDIGDKTTREAHLERQVNRLKNLVGELTLELKKSDEVLS
jgi:transposase-like protein